MTGRSSRQVMEQRIAAFWSLLYGERGERVGEAVSYTEFATAASKDANSQITERACQNTLQQMQKGPAAFPGTRLIVGQKEARLTWTARRVFDDRDQTRPATKTRLGRLVWKLLFDVGAPEPKWHASEHAKRRLDEKINALRKKSPVQIFCDAGSTTTRCIGELLKLPTIPLHVPTAEIGKEQDTHSGGYRLVSPHITTNCPEIATKISQSSHYQDVGVTLIGGDQRSERGSICGSLAQSWIAHINPQGDVCIVGSTGYRRDSQGRPGFGSDNHEEADIKASFISRTWLRICLLGADKFSAPPVSRIFATLTPENLDLVVTDDGDSKGEGEYTKEVNSFCDEAMACDVPVAVLTSLQE